ncbi:MAG: hypothetical protein Q4E81_03900 [Succinatimonas sp.]|nr:hypothetical protein [Succinatimonas sp.]
MPKRNLPPNVYLQSYLRKAGIRFEVNTVDTICSKGLGISFYVIFTIFALIWVLKISGQLGFLPHGRFVALISVTSVYLLYYLLRVAYYNRKSKILKNDRTPIPTEAYAIVILDELKSIFPWNKSRRSAVLYKEIGSMQPRFFTGAIRYGFKQHYHKNQIAKVFIDRKDPKIYTVDDIHAHQTVSKKILGARLAINDLDRSSFKVKQN